MKLRRSNKYRRVARNAIAASRTGGVVVLTGNRHGGRTGHARRVHKALRKELDRAVRRHRGWSPR